ncbi:MAG: nuclear transport factor 2 family protein [Rhizobiaceae bacterium]
MTDLEANKANVVVFYDMMFNQNEPRQAIETYIDDEYIKHNPQVVSDKEWFSDYFERIAANYPGKRMLAGGNYVVLHCHQIWPDEEYAGIDISRLDENSKAVEHWDVLQTLPQTSANSNGMF